VAELLLGIYLDLKNKPVRITIENEGDKMKKWMVKRIVEYKQIVDAESRINAKEEFSLIDAHFHILREIIRPAKPNELQ
jgi:hypothetical protein